jgi:DMSO/TMAO reductase YedYZ molybdopterin-dependent catalytic subunit
MTRTIRPKRCRLTHAYDFQEHSEMHKLLRSFLWIALIILSLAASGYGQGQQDSSAALLRVVGPGGPELRVTAQDWAKLPRATVTAMDHGGAQVTFEGVPARELLKLAGAPFGHELRGQRLSLYVLAEASDGYKALYALAEFDADFTDGLILIADRKNGEALAPKEGPLQMVVPWEKRQARWVRQLTLLRVGQAL